jgi:hypothetical protein
VDEERSNASDQGLLKGDNVPKEEAEPEEPGDVLEKPHSDDTGVAEDSLRQRKSQHANKGS